MKKIVLTIALAAFAFAANAQFVIGGQIGFNTNGGKQWGSTNVSGTTVEITVPSDVTTSFVFAPKFGYNLNEKMHVGIVLGYNSVTEKEYSNYSTYYRGGHKGFEGWDKTKHTYFFFAPYFRYTFMSFNKLSVFAEAQLTYGFAPKASVRSYNTAIAGIVAAHDATTKDVFTTSEFSLTAVPGVNYRFSNHFSADLYIDLLGISYTSVTTHNTANNAKLNNHQFACLASFNAESLADHLNLFRIGFNYHF